MSKTQLWLARLEAQDLLSAPVRDLREALVDPQTQHNGMLVEGRSSNGGSVRLVASPIQLSGWRAGLRRAPPQLGEHTEEVLSLVRARASGKEQS